VLILEQHVPFGQWAPQAAIDALAAVLVSNGKQSGPQIGMQKGPLTGVGAGLSR
jgi:hypothetical protein